MTQHRNLDHGQKLPEAVLDAIQELLGTYVSGNFQLSLANPTTIQVVAGPGDDQRSIAIDGRWRFNTATVNAAHPGGAAGTHDVYVTASDNDFVAGTPETDNTVYTFGLEIRTSGTPSTALHRKIGTVTWSGTAITLITPLVSSPGSPGLEPGLILDFAGAEDKIAARRCPADGRALTEAGEPGLFEKIGHSWDTFGGLPAPAAGSFRAPDLRGRGTVGKGDMGSGTAPTPAGSRVARTGINTLATLLGVEYHPLTVGELAPHDHGGVTGGQSADHTHSGTTGAGSAHSHGHTLTLPNHTHTGGEASNQTGQATGNDAHNYWSGSGNTGGVTSTPAINGSISSESSHTHSFTTGGTSTGHTHSISSQGSGSAHDNLHPVAVVNKIVTL